MAAWSAALALLGGVIGAGFASGREILHFFAGHGAMAPAAVSAACVMLLALFERLPALMRRTGTDSLAALCKQRLGRRFGRLCAGLFMLLCAVTGAAMLAACAELGALVLPIRYAYGASLCATLVLSSVLALMGLSGLALPGALLAALMPVLLLRLMALPAGEACFLPAMAPDLPVSALADGAAYGALSAAQLAGLLPMLAAQKHRTHTHAALLFSLLFGAMLWLGTAVCQRFMPAVTHQALPFVYLSRSLGPSGYLLVALCMYTAALSTLCAMQRALMLSLPLSGVKGAMLVALGALALSLVGFDALIARGYPMLGALCAGLLIVLCMPVCQQAGVCEH